VYNNHCTPPIHLSPRALRVLAPLRETPSRPFHKRPTPTPNLVILRKTGGLIPPNPHLCPKIFCPFHNSLRRKHLHMSISGYMSIFAKPPFWLYEKNKILSPCPISLCNKIKRILLQRSRFYGIYTFMSPSRSDSVPRLKLQFAQFNLGKRPFLPLPLLQTCKTKNLPTKTYLSPFRLPPSKRPKHAKLKICPRKLIRLAPYEIPSAQLLISAPLQD
jgi:hypothetical protein